MNSITFIIILFSEMIGTCGSHEETVGFLYTGYDGSIMLVFLISMYGWSVSDDSLNNLQL